jgi:demethylmenaquinone methyltransferase/2-methoxy-6-polyprenyl-1,4-benzoquinol methylase
MESELLLGQIDYYRERAAEYDEWFFRQGRYDRGEETNRAWFHQVEEVRAGLAQFNPTGDVLELAGGTGLWSERLVTTAKSLTVVDASPEMMEINGRRLDKANVRYILADLFEWQPDRQYDAVFFSFWLSHVPPTRFEGFWHAVASALKTGAKVFLVDSRFERSSTAVDHVLPGEPETTVNRKLNDGRSFTIVKMFYDAADLSRMLAEIGWTAKLTDTQDFFVYGSVERT